MSDNVKRFYDQFLDDRMVGYRIDGNLRISKAVEFAKEHIRPGAMVADIGCGIGILAEAVAKGQPGSTVIGIDISEANIRYASDTVREPNLQFISASVTEQFERLRSAAGRPVDVFCMVDVIEHIPEQARPALFGDMAQMASEEAKLLLTYPSPEYQRHLKEREPEELQVVDNVVEIGDLVREAASAGWNLQSFAYVDMWRSNQYIHASFRRSVPLRELPTKASLPARLLRRLDRQFFRPGRVRKYARRAG